MSDFKNPYINVPSDQVKRTNNEIAESDWNLLRSVRVKQGTFTTAVNLLIFKLCNECRERNLTDMSQHKEFEQFVAGLHLVPDEEYQSFLADAVARRLRDSTFDRIGGGGTTREDDNRGTSSESGSAKEPTVSAASLPSRGTGEAKRSRAAKRNKTSQP